jgi:hypothetical protein
MPQPYGRVRCASLAMTRWVWVLSATREHERSGRRWLEAEGMAALRSQGLHGWSGGRELGVGA